MAEERTLKPVEWKALVGPVRAFQQETQQPLLWTQNPFAKSRPSSMPPSVESVEVLDIRAAVNELETAALLISNVFGKDDLELRIQVGEPEAVDTNGEASKASGDGKEPLRLSDIEVAEAMMFRTGGGGVIAEPVVRLDAAGRIRVPAGQTREVWLTIDTTDVRPGRYDIPVAIHPLDYSTGLKPMRVLVRVRIWDIELPKKMPISVYNFDYGRGAYENPQYLEDMLRHRVNVFFVPNVPGPDENGHADFSTLDTAIERLSPHGQLFLEVWFMRQSNGWRSHYAQWVRELAAYMTSRGLDYEDWLLQVYDESMSDQFLQCAKQIKQADPNVRIFQDHMAPAERVREFAPYIDVWCPVHHQLTDSNGLEAMRATGKPVWTYECGTTPVETPRKHRGVTWRAWHHKLDGTTYWTYSDCKWNDPSVRENYGVIYRSVTGGPITSKRWEAWREGQDDYLYLTVYEDELAKGGEPSEKDRALLDEAHETATKGQVEMDQYDRLRRRVAHRILELRGAKPEPDFR